MDKLKAISAFIKIVELGSFTAAADALETSSPSIVRKLAALEKELGVRLLNRTTRTLALTEEGRLYFERGKQILADLEHAELELSAKQVQPQGRLMVSAPVLFGRLHVMPLVHSFVEKYPQTKVELMLIDRMVNLVEEGYDVSIRIGALIDSSLIAVPIGYFRLVVCASPEYLAENGRPQHPDELRSHNCLCIPAITESRSWRFVDKGKSIKVPVKGSITCNQAAATIDACVAGAGIGLFMCYQVDRVIKEKKLELLFEKYGTEVVPVAIVYPHAKLLSNRVRTFVDFLKAELTDKFSVTK